MRGGGEFAQKNRIGTQFSARVLQVQTKDCIGGVKLSLNESQTYTAD